MSDVRLMQGCCLERMGEIADGSVDMVCADLPFQVTDCKWDVLIPFELLWEHYRRVVKPNGAIVLMACGIFEAALKMSNPKMFRYEWIWDKVNRNTNYANARKMPMRRHENILVFYRRLPTYNPQMTPGVPYAAKRSGKNPDVYADGAMKRGYSSSNAARFPHTLLSIPANNNAEAGLHPTQKPVALCEYLIRTYTNPGETVLDNTAGSFSTGVACVTTGRNFIGIEKDEAYFRLGSERIAAAQSQLTLTDTD